MKKKLIIPQELQGKRIDQALSALWPDCSRMQIIQWLREGSIRVNQNTYKPKQKIKGGEMIEWTPLPSVKTADIPEFIALSIVYEDDSILIIDKPAHLVVHPGAGNEQGTLLNALLYHDSQLAQLPRAGIIHRLDKDTSGLLIIAKTLPAYTRLVRDLQRRKITREYEAVVCGALTGGGIIDLPIGRHNAQRKKMAIQENGKSAITRYVVKERFRAHTHIRVKLETGRTHQIRVHLASQGYPLVGDPLYGGRMKVPKRAHPELLEALRQFKRQALHAVFLRFNHPKTGESVEYHSPLARDIQHVLNLLRKDTSSNAS